MPARLTGMKLRQTVRHWAAKQALATPVVGDYVAEKLVSLHTGVFLARADPDRRDERREHLDALFAGTIDAYEAALREGYTEAEAREITHIQANLDFAARGWTEMMEFPVSEVDAPLDRYADFFEAHGIAADDPLGEFEPADFPDAPATPERLEAPDQPHAEGGYADDVYVQDESGEVTVGGGEEPADVDVAEAPGLGDADRGDG